MLAAMVQAQSRYDAMLSAKLKADDMGMRTYVMALLKAGPNRDRPNEIHGKIEKPSRRRRHRPRLAGSSGIQWPRATAGEHLLHFRNFDALAALDALRHLDDFAAIGQRDKGARHRHSSLVMPDHQLEKQDLGVTPLRHPQALEFVVAGHAMHQRHGSAGSG